MEFENEVALPSYGHDVWVDDDDEAEEFVDDFLWPVVNALATGNDIRGSDTWNAMNRALTQPSGPFVYRLGNLGMTYDSDLIEEMIHVDEDVIETDSFGEMLSTLRNIYVVHEEEQAVALLDAFMSRASPCVVLKMPLDAVM
jgi:hypothetical protein